MRYNKNHKKNKILILLLLILLLLSFAGCNSQSTNPTETIEVKTIFDSYEEPERPIDEAERLLKEYSPEYYLRDYSEVKERLNKEAQEYFTELFYAKFETHEDREEFEGYVNDDLRILTDVFLYNKSFYEAEQNNLSFEDIWNNKEEYLKYVNVYFISFKEIDIQDEGEDDRFFKYYLFIDGIASPEETQYFHEIVGVYDQRIIKETDLDSLLELNDLELISKALDGMCGDYQFYVQSKNSPTYRNYGGEYGARDHMNHLKNKYGMEFRPSFFAESLAQMNFHPVDYPEVDFAAAGDKFKSAFFQYILSNKVNEILKKHEIDHVVGQFTYVHTDNRAEIDMNRFEADNNKFIFEIMTNVDITLYMLEVEKDEIDFQRVIASIADIQELFNLESDNKSSISVYVFRYKLDSVSEREVVLDLFKTYRSSENYIRDKNGIDTWAQNMWVVRNETDCFKYLDLIRDDSKKIYRLLHKIGATHDVDVFLEKYEVETIFD